MDIIGERPVLHLPWGKLHVEGGNTDKEEMDMTYWFGELLAFISDVQVKKKAILDEIKRLEKLIDQVRDNRVEKAYGPKRVINGFNTGTRGWNHWLNECEKIERDTLRLEGSVRLLLNLSSSDNIGSHTNRWGAPFEPTLEIVIENLGRLFRRVDEFNLHVQDFLRCLDGMTRNSSDGYSWYKDHIFPPDASVDLRADLDGISIVHVKNKLTRGMYLSSRCVLPNSGALL
jgi:hypothetical protein